MLWNQDKLVTLNLVLGKILYEKREEMRYKHRIVKNGPLALACTFAKIVEVDFVGFWTMNNLGTTQVPTMYRCFNSELRGWQHRSRTISFSCQAVNKGRTELIEELSIRQNLA